MKEQPVSIKHIIVWSVIAAAFIGPGTVTTASAAGANYGYGLIWTLLLATLFCILIQESSARLSIINRKNLMEVFHLVFPKGQFMYKVVSFMGLTIILGCIAYQTGNIVGAAEGISLLFDVPAWSIILVLSLSVTLLLYTGKHVFIGKVLSIIVGFMGISFIALALVGPHSFDAIVSGFQPSLPDGSFLIAMGLIGTTIVPYNVFLGSGISEGQSIRSMRAGLFISIFLGGVISACILINGALIQSEFSFQALAHQLEQSVGSWGPVLLGFGLFSAGFTSAVTAPLAAAFISQGIFPKKTTAFKLTWMVVVLTGFIFGIVGMKPVPLIIAAQALNGFLLPFIAVLLWIVLNHPKANPQVPPIWYNLLFASAVWIISYLGMISMEKNLQHYLNVELGPTFGIVGASLMVVIGVVYIMMHRPKREPIYHSS